MPTEEDIKKPFKDSLWMACLFKLYDKAKAEGKEYINFVEVDWLVVEKSKTIVKWEFDDAD